MTKSHTPDMDVGTISRAKAFPINAQGGLHMHVVHLIFVWLGMDEPFCDIIMRMGKFL